MGWRKMRRRRTLVMKNQSAVCSGGNNVGSRVKRMGERDKSGKWSALRRAVEALGEQSSRSMGSELEIKLLVGSRNFITHCSTYDQLLDCQQGRGTRRFDQGSKVG
jgi:hypothetical protein